MKTLKLALYFVIGGLFIFLSSCENTQEELNGKIDFSMSINDSNLLKSFQSDTLDPETEPFDSMYSWHLLVSIVNESGAFVFEDEIIPLYSFGNDFISEKLSLKTGRYMLQKFLVIDPYGDVRFASPMKGSDLAYLVNRPLPLGFEILPEQTSRLVPEVLAINGSNPEDFGYASFGFQVVHPIIAYVMVVDDNPLYMRPSSAIPALLSLYAIDGWYYDYKLTASINKILVKSGYDGYKVLVQNPNFPPYDREISRRELLNSSEDNPIIFNLAQQAPYSLILQPGPREGKDAMITDLNPADNFGDYPYFEASFITEPVLTVMRTKQSLIDFDLSDLPKSALIESVLLTLTFENIICDTIWAELDDFMILDQGLVLQQIVEPWEEYEVNWENQPQSIEVNQVFIPLWDEYSSNVRSYDVTSLFVPIQEIAAPNYGMMFKVYPDNAFPGGWSYASSDHQVEKMRPKLTVKYSLY